MSGYEISPYKAPQFRSEGLEDIASQEAPAELQQPSPIQMDGTGAQNKTSDKNALISRPEWKAKHERFNKKASMHLLVTPLAFGTFPSSMSAYASKQEN